MHPKRNFLRPLIPCVVLGVGGVASIAATVAMLAPITNSMASREARGATQPQPQPPKPPIEVGNELVRITASLDRTEVGVGEEPDTYRKRPCRLRQGDYIDDAQ